MERSILILGAGSDIAEAIAHRFAREKYTVILAGRRNQQMARLSQALIHQYGATVYYFTFDAAQFHQHQPFIDNLPLLPDIVVYSAGYMCTQQEALAHWAHASNMIKVNYSGPVSILNAFSKAFEARRSGCIVGISSVAGERGRASNYMYGSTKAAFTAYLSGLRQHLSGRGVRVITVKPGFVYSKMTRDLDLPKRLTASPEFVADKLYAAIKRKRSVVYVKPVWRLIMAVIRNLPEGIFKRMKL